MQGIDGVRKIPRRAPFTTNVRIHVVKPEPVIPRVVHTETFAPQEQITAPVFKQKRFFSFRQITTIAITFIITFVFSLATSNSLASHNKGFSFNKKNEVVETKTENSLAVLSTPMFVEIDGGVVDEPREVHLPREGLTLPDPLQQRKEFLEQYLRSRNSPLAEHVDAISEQSQWKLIIGIARAESSFCKRHLNNNCWGIGGAWNLKKYKSYDEAVADVNRILETYYIQSGLDTPEKIVRKYVGHPSDNWEMAVQQELDNLKDVE